MIIPRRDIYLAGTLCAVALLALIAAVLTSRSAPSATLAARSPSAHTVVASGDIACASTSATDALHCRQADTAQLVRTLNPEAVLVLGDVQYPIGTYDEFVKSYDKTWGTFKSITYPVPGNHDYATKDGTGYYTYFGDRAGDPNKGYYSFVIGGWKLIALNSEIDIAPQSKQVEWLRRELTTDPKKCTLAYWHHPRFSTTLHGDDSRSDALWQELYKYNADLILAGHSHSYERYLPLTPNGEHDPDWGITQIVAGMGGHSTQAMQTPSPHLVARQSHVFGVLKLTLYENHALFQFLSVPGEQKFEDSGKIRCH